MGVHNDLSIPGGLQFFHGYGPAPVLGPCPHDCLHNARAVIAWGPDWKRYELIECGVDEGCDKRCRGWKRVEDWDDRGTIDSWAMVGEQTPLYGMDQIVIPANGAPA